ncbi:ABC transporter ATP-binding protein [Hyperthermus butylicus]|uniref:ABC transporter, ATP binding n=1 Tax=Hyperthermus butylicus (strain DSM 5456 / JCM 9403 / PLM1-5) TaxID=415426 RepID=A2BJE2_HYPBU|nr:ATP-binding cassette domain-containing protein [Hyperthermus butylicus]ABM80103.1 ABC transporter, ATP binding [Hyperthermus butylicus DSM 5456]
MSNGFIVEAHGLGKAYGSLCVFRDVSFSLGAGEALLITGPNGSGKTTLLMIVAGFKEPSWGSVAVFGRELARLSRAERARLRRWIGFVFQEPVLIDSLSALDNVVLAGVLAGLEAGEARRAAQRILEQLGIGSRAFEKAGRLSGGERKRVELARALVRKPRLLLVDEPFAMLDETASRLVREALESYVEEGGALIAAMPRSTGVSSSLPWRGL